MDKWHQSLRQDRCRETRDPHNPSFSSTLLDAIYRSIDEGEGGKDHGGMVFYKSDEALRRKQQQQQHGHKSGGNGARKAAAAVAEEEVAGLRRAIMIEKWMEKKATEKVVACRSSAVTPAPEDYEKGSRRWERREYPLIHSSSSSSESSCGGGFSSSEAESLYGVNADFSKPPPKPIRTSAKITPAERSGKPRKESQAFDRPYNPKQKHDGGGGSGNSKSKALKFYAELKKVKQPISPGAKLAGFLNSLFNAAGNSKKKPKRAPSSNLGNRAGGDDSGSERTFKSAHASTCSSASSFSRSCLSKTPSTAATCRKLTNAVAADAAGKRSVRFFPVSAIVDEDSRLCGHKSVYGDPNRPAVVDEELNSRAREGSRRAAEPARDLPTKTHLKQDESEDDEESDIDDAASCSSSDLFELDNLAAIGDERYRQELPVYGTTILDGHRNVARSFVL